MARDLAPIIFKFSTPLKNSTYTHYDWPVSFASAMRGRQWRPCTAIQRCCQNSWSKLGASSNRHHWLTWSPNILECRDVLWSVFNTFIVTPFRFLGFSEISVTASPYLLSLGLSKSSMAIVFVAGPMSGLIMQPLIGAYPSWLFSKYYLMSHCSQASWQTTLCRVSVAGDLICYSEHSYAYSQCCYWALHERLHLFLPAGIPVL
jgi:hypothetical protein